MDDRLHGFQRSLACEMRVCTEIGEAQACDCAQRELAKFVNQEWAPHKKLIVDDIVQLATSLEESQHVSQARLACRVDWTEKELRRLGSMAGFGLDQMQVNLDLLVAADLVRV